MAIKLWGKALSALAQAKQNVNQMTQRFNIPKPSPVITAFREGIKKYNISSFVPEVEKRARLAFQGAKKTYQRLETKERILKQQARPYIPFTSEWQAKPSNVLAQKMFDPIKKQWQKDKPYFQAQTREKVFLPPQTFFDAVPQARKWVEEKSPTTKIRPSTLIPPLGLTKWGRKEHEISPGKILTTLTTERPEVTKIREKLQIGERLTPKEQKMAQGEMLLFLGDIALTASPEKLATRITKAGKEIPIVRGKQTIKANIVESPGEMKDIKHIDVAFRDFYRNTEAVLGEKAGPILDSFDAAKKGFVEHQTKWLGELKEQVIKKGIKKKSKQSKLVQMFGEGDISLEKLKKEPKWQNIVEADKWFRKTYDQLLNEINSTYKAIGKTEIPKRKDYYRHFQELDELRGLKNIFESQQAIDPRLAGVSDYTQPTSKWLSLAQQRLGIKTDKDAVGGFLNYIKSASYAINIDPQIGKMRALQTGLAEQTVKSKHLNNYIEYLSDFANSLSGKTSPYDRPVQKILGRKTFGVMNWLNNRVKANAVLGNLRSSFSQILNMPQNIASAGKRNALAGAYEAATNPLTKTDFAVENSFFLKERFLHKKYQAFDTKLIDQPKKLAAWILGVLDDYGSRATWLSHFRKGVNEGMEEAAAIKYADRTTRKLVGGRGIGEVPEVYKSRIFNLVAPFQLEVGNTWQVMRDFVGKKEFGKLMTLFVASWGFNEVMEGLHGDRVLFDPIDVLYDNLFGEDKDTTIAQKGGRIAGEVLSSLPGGQIAAAGYPEHGIKIGDKEIPGRKELFGKQDPTRYGTGLLLTKGLQDPLHKIIPPWGGSQFKKTKEGIEFLKSGYSITPSGKVRYKTPETAAGKARAVVFGQWSTKEAQEYFDGGSHPTAVDTNIKRRVAKAIMTGDKKKLEELMPDVKKYEIPLKDVAKEAFTQVMSIKDEKKRKKALKDILPFIKESGLKASEAETALRQKKYTPTVKDGLVRKFVKAKTNKEKKKILLEIKASGMKIETFRKKLLVYQE